MVRDARHLSLPPSLSLSLTLGVVSFSLSLSFLSSLVRLSRGWRLYYAHGRNFLFISLSTARFVPKKEKSNAEKGIGGLTLTFNTNSLSSLYAGETSERGDVATHRWFLSRRGVCEHF